MTMQPRANRVFMAIPVSFGVMSAWSANACGAGLHVSPPPLTATGAESLNELSAEMSRLADHAVTARMDYVSMLFVFMLATFIGIGVIRRVSRLLHTPLMSLTNAISAIAVVGAIIVAGDSRYPWGIRLLGSVALFASMTNIISGFMITDRMLKMFKTGPKAGTGANS